VATSKTYFVAWDEMLPNCLEIDRQLTEGNLDFLAFDVTTEPVARKNWIVAEKVRYYGHFYNALKDFKETDHLLFAFNAGDAFTDKHVEMTNRFTQLMAEDENIWVMGPNQVWDGPSTVTTSILKSKKYPKLHLSVHIDGTIVMLRRELSLYVLDFYEWMLANNIMNFSTMHSGHSLDVVYCAWAIVNNKKVYKDGNFEVRTVQGSSYITNTAKESKAVLTGFASYVFKNGRDPREVLHVYDAFFKRLSMHPENNLDPLVVYRNASSIEELDV